MPIRKGSTTLPPALMLLNLARFTFLPPTTTARCPNLDSIPRSHKHRLPSTEIDPSRWILLAIDLVQITFPRLLDPQVLTARTRFASSKTIRTECAAFRQHRHLHVFEEFHFANHTFTAVVLTLTAAAFT